MMENTPAVPDAAVHEVTRGHDLVTQLRSLLRLAPSEDPVVKLVDDHFVEISNSMNSALRAFNTFKSMDKAGISTGASAKSSCENPKIRSYYSCSNGEQVSQAKKQVQQKDCVGEPTYMANDTHGNTCKEASQKDPSSLLYFESSTVIEPLSSSFIQSNQKDVVNTSSISSSYGSINTNSAKAGRIASLEEEELNARNHLNNLADYLMQDDDGDDSMQLDSAVGFEEFESFQALI